MTNANNVTTQVQEGMSEEEQHDKISARTKAALAAAKARGVKLGVKGRDNLRPNIEARQAAADEFAARLRPIIEDMVARGLTHRAMAEELNKAGIKTPRGGEWTHGQVPRLLGRLAETNK